MSMPEIPLQVIGENWRPSAAGRWSTCTASVKAIANEPPSKGSKASIEGNVAHELFDEVGKTGVPAKSLMGKYYDKYPGVPVDEAMCEGIIEAREYVERVAAADPALYAEGESPMTITLGNTGSMNGTADHVLLGASGMLHVFDLKYGANPRNKVYADDPQLMLYALGVVQLLATIDVFPTAIRTHVIQPRCNHFHYHDTSIDGMRIFAQMMESSMAESKGANAVYRPSTKACKWCPIKATCTARASQAVGAMSSAFGLGPKGEIEHSTVVTATGIVQEPNRDQGTLTDEQINGLLQYVDGFKAWASELWAHAQAKEEEAPGTFTDWKVVKGKDGNAQFADEEAAIKAMRAAKLKKADYTIETIISYAKARDKVTELLAAAPKVTKKAAKLEVENNWKEIVTKTPGKPIMVPSTDKRTRLTGTSAAEKFNVNETTN